MTGRPGYRTMEMNGGSSAPYLARTPCVPLFCTLFNRGGNRRVFRLPGAGGDHFHCTVEPSPGHIRCRMIKLDIHKVSGISDPGFWGDLCLAPQTPMVFVLSVVYLTSGPLPRIQHSTPSRSGDPPVTGGVTGQKDLCLCAFFFPEYWAWSF